MQFGNLDFTKRLSYGGGGGGGGGWRFMEFWGEGGLKHNGMDGIVSIMFRPFADG